MNHIILRNGQSTATRNIPLLDYSLFRKHILSLLENAACHCMNYYAYRKNEKILHFICCIGNDETSEIYNSSFEYDLIEKKPLDSITREYFGMHIFEREISENFGIEFIGHPWNKPVRYAFDRSDKENFLNNYPFY